MAWVRLDDGFPEHPKVLAAGRDAAWLYLCALCYSNRVLSDGYITRAGVHQLISSTDPRTLQKLCRKLEGSGLWESIEGGWVIHDFLEYQPARSQVESQRKEARERMAEKRARSAELRANTSENVRPKFADPNPTQPNKEKTKVKTTVDVAVDRDVVGRIWDTWIASTGRTRSVFTDKRRRLTKTWLKVYPEALLTAAVQGWSNSPFHRGENDRGRVYNDYELILRDEQHIEDFADLYFNGESVPAPTVRSDEATLARVFAQAKLAESNGHGIAIETTGRLL